MRLVSASRVGGVLTVAGADFEQAPPLHVHRFDVADGGDEGGYLLGGSSALGLVWIHPQRLARM